MRTIHVPAAHAPAAGQTLAVVGPGHSGPVLVLAARPDPNFADWVELDVDLPDRTMVQRIAEAAAAGYAPQPPRLLRVG
jgi:hypothetical protein